VWDSRDAAPAPPFPGPGEEVSPLLYLLKPDPKGRR